MVGDDYVCPSSAVFSYREHRLEGVGERGEWRMDDEGK